MQHGLLLEFNLYLYCYALCPSREIVDATLVTYDVFSVKYFQYTRYVETSYTLLTDEP